LKLCVSEHIAKQRGVLGDSSPSNGPRNFVYVTAIERYTHTQVSKWAR